MAESRLLQLVISAKDEASKTLSKMNAYLKDNEKNFQDMAKYGGVAFGALSVAIGKTVKDSSNFESISIGFQRTARHYGASADEMTEALNRVSRGTISNTDLMLSSNKAMALGVGNNLGEVTQLLEIARMKGQALGLDTTQAFNDIVTGIGRGSPMILDNLGIITKGWDEEAKAMGVAMDKQFVLNKILEDGTAELKEMGEVLLTPNERFQQMKTQIDNTSVTIGQMFLPIIANLAGKVSIIIERFATWASEHEKLIKVVVIIAGALSGFLLLVGSMGLILPVIIKGFSLLGTAIGYVTKAVKLLIANPILIFLALAVAGVIYLSEKFGGLKNAFLVIGSAFAILGNLVVAGLKGLANSVIQFVNKALKVGNNIYNFFSGLLEKVGVDIGKADMSIDFEFNAEQNFQNIDVMLDAMDAMKIEASNKKQQANDEMASLYNADLATYTAIEEDKAEAGAKTAKTIEEAYKEMGESFKTVMTESQEAIKETATKITELQEKISELFVGKAKDDLSMRQSYAQAYVDQEQKTNDLKIKWQQETDQEKKDSLFDEYVFNKELLEKKKNIEIAYGNEVNEVRRRNSLSDFERQLEDLELKTTILNQEFEQKYKALQKELHAEEEKFIAIANLQAWAMTEADKSLAKGEKDTIDSVNRQIAYYNKLAEAVRNAKSGNMTGYASLARGTNERATASNTKPNVNITVNGDVSGQELVSRVRDGIMEELRFNTQLAF